ncbi:MAG: DUF2201 family putative metallopeptidase [Atopobiaceae bacterium]|jgi:hypothetical protein
MAASKEEPAERARAHELALKVVDLARYTILSENHFLMPAVELLQPKIKEGLGTIFSTDGRSLFIDPDMVLDQFSQTRQPPVHDLCHVIVHCLLLHPFTTSKIDAKAWSLASDIVAEHVTAELCRKRPGARGEALDIVFEQLSEDLGDKPTTERIYRALEDGRYANVRERWAEAFKVDDATAWFGSSRKKAAQKPSEGSGQQPQGSGQQPQGSGQQPSPSSAHELAHEASFQSDDADGAPDTAQLEARWRHIGKSVRLNLETISKSRGQALGHLHHELEVSGRPHQDLREFLRQFVRVREAMRVSPDEFDYVFYSLGLSLYGNMPLMENLEYREEHAIYDFIIVIDTSASVEGDAVRSFVECAFDVIEQGSGGEHINVHLIQADAAVRSDTVIDTHKDLERWSHEVTLEGFGGTDFRPAFDYVDALIADRRMHKVSGMIYFTDGWGIYPERVPSYKCAFVFLDDTYRKEIVPPWAMQFVLSEHELKEVRG